MQQDLRQDCECKNLQFLELPGTNATPCTMRTLTILIALATLGAAYAALMEHTTSTDSCGNMAVYPRSAATVADALRVCEAYGCSFAESLSTEAQKCMHEKLDVNESAWVALNSTGCYFLQGSNIPQPMLSGNCGSAFNAFTCECSKVPQPPALECGNLRFVSAPQGATAFDALRICAQNNCRLPTSISPENQPCAIKHLFPRQEYNIAWAQINEAGCWRLGGIGYPSTLLQDSCAQTFRDVLCECAGN
eukprot:m.29652 g.29652  ORF g.29652 m.29652 type:complete len:249 (+) comp5118_c0_seq1:2181-2927(+)